MQFVGCDGVMLFRTWAPYSDAADLTLPQPAPSKKPIDAVTVLDVEKFAVGFMRTLLSASAGSEIPIELTMSIDEVESEQLAIGDETVEYVLTLQALGQRLSCKLYEGQFPDWRGLEYGVEPGELVDGMTLAPRMFAAVGKLKDVRGIECSFRGEERAIDFRSLQGGAAVCGLLMPMRKPTDRQKPKGDDDDAQMEHES